MFGRTLPFDFVSWDDPLHILLNPYLRALSWSNLAAIWQRPYEELYIPVSYTFLACLAEASRRLVGDLSPALFHLGSLLMHLGCTLLVFDLLRMLVGRLPAALVGALWFSLHPLQVESVAWISETRGLLAGLLALAALRLYAAGPRDDDASWVPSTIRQTAVADQRPLPPPLWIVCLAPLLAALAMLAKPSVASVPLTALCLDVWQGRRPLRASLLRLVPWFAAALVVVAITHRYQAGSLSFEPPRWPWRLLVAGDALAFYLVKLALPWPLAMDYGRTPAVVLAGTWKWVAWLFPVGLALLAARLNHARIWLAALAVFTAGLLPVSGLISFRYQYFSTVADRYAYMAMLGSAMALAVAWALTTSRTVKAVVVVVLGLFGGLSFIQAGCWRDSETLYRHTLEVNPRSFTAHNNLANLLDVRGAAQQAAEHYQQAADLNPRDAKIQTNLGRMLARQGRFDEAEARYRAALEADPRYAEAHAHWGVLLARRNDPDGAMVQYEAALAIDAAHAESHYNRGLIHRQRGAAGAARADFAAAVAARADFVEAHQALGELLVQAGQPAAALPHFEVVCRVEPYNVEGLTLLGYCLARTGQARQAAALWRQAMQLDPRHPGPPLNLANLLARQQRYVEAEQLYEHVLRLDPGHGEAQANLRQLRQAMQGQSGPAPP